MQASMDEPLERAIATLDDLIGMAGARGLGDSVMFLEMAKLQVKLDLHGITEDEFAAFCEALENGPPESGTAARLGYHRTRRDGVLRGQGRAWKGEQGIAPRRPGRRRARQ